MRCTPANSREDMDLSAASTVAQGPTLDGGQGAGAVAEPVNPVKPVKTVKTV